jgi:hypothetical protein
MPLIAQICMVVVTIAAVGMAVMSIRLMLQTKVLIENANRSLGQLPALIEDVKRASARADELLLAFSHITRAAKTGAAELESIATRSGTLANSVLDEIERPISQTVTMLRGLRLGAEAIIQRLQTRGSGRSNSNQGEDNVREQRWLDDGGALAGRSGRSGRDSAPGSNGG